MSVPDTAAPRKYSRLGLYIPFGLAAVAAIAWSIFWVWARGQVEARMDAGVKAQAAAGRQIAWTRREIGGFPFRLDVTLTDLSARDASGWALQTPTLEGEAFLYDPGHWMFAAPKGLTFVRPQGGPVAVSGRVLRASLNELGKRPPSFSFQALDAKLTPAPGAEPFPFQSFGTFELHLRPGPDDEGGVFLNLEGGHGRPGGVLERVAPGKAVAMAWNSTLSKMSAFSGADWPSAVRGWSDAGGRMTVRDAKLVAGEAQVLIAAGDLGVGHDGRVAGTLPAEVHKAPQILGALAAEGLIPTDVVQLATTAATARQTGDAVRTSLVFQAGQTTLGPVALAPAPKIYTAP